MSTIVLTYDGSPIPDVQWASATFESQMGGIPGTFEFTVKDINQVYEFVTGKHITLTIDGQLYFGGFVTQVTRKFALPVDDTSDVPSVMTRQWVLRGVDYNVYFDKRVIFNVASPKSGIPDYTGSPDDKQVITQLCNDYLVLGDTSIDFTTYVDSVGNPYGTEDENGDPITSYTYDTPSTPWREVMNDIVQWTGAIYYFDHSQNLHYHELETVASAWNFSDTPNGTTTFGFREFEYLEDGSNLCNDALVWGGAAWTSTGSTAVVNFGRWENNTSIGARGRWQRAETHFQENGFASDANCALHAKIIVEGSPGAALAGLPDTVRGLVNPQKQIRLTWFGNRVPSPLIPGSVVYTTVNSFGITLALPVRSIRITFVTPLEAKFQGFFGILTEDPWTLWKYLRKLQQTDQAGVPAEPTSVSDGSTSSPGGTFVAMQPSPLPDGSTTVFSVTDQYVSGSLQVWMNGLLQRNGTEYSTDPAAATFEFVDPPLSGDRLWVEYISAGG